MSERGPAARALRVLHVGKFYPPHKGGMETHLRDLCERLARDIEVGVVVAAGGGDSLEETQNGVRVARVGTRLRVGATSFCPGTARRIRESGADLVHLHWPNPAAVISFLASRWRGPAVLTWHSDVVRQRVSGGAFAPVLERFLARCGAIIATSPDYAASSPVLRRHRSRCHVIPLGVDASKFERADERAVRDVRERYGPRIVLGVGRMIYYKGFAHLVRAMRGVDARLLLIGSGPLRAELEALRDELSLGGRVSFLGEVPDAAPYFAAADVFALPSVARSEAFGIVQLEAMACGVPVVNTRLDSGVPFVSPDGVSGLTVPPADAPALAAAINRLLADPGLRARLGAAGKRRVAQEFSADLMAERILRLYRDVLRSAGEDGDSHEHA